MLIERACRFIGQQDFRPIHERATKRGALALASGEFLNAVVEPMGESGPLREFHKARLRGAAVGPRGNGGNETILRECQIGDQVMELKNKTNLMPQKPQKVGSPFDFRPVHPNLALIGKIQPGEQVQKGAFAAARGTTQSHGPTLEAPNVHALENRNGPLVVAFPKVHGAQNNAPFGIVLNQGLHSNRSASTARIRIA